MNNLLWEEVVKFHGHKCPGIAMGFKACEVISSKIDKDDEIICISENNTCPVDAIKYIFKCDYDKGNLILKEDKDLAFNIFNKTKNFNFRVVYKGKNNCPTKEEYMNYILNAPIDELFDFTEVKYSL